MKKYQYNVNQYGWLAIIGIILCLIATSCKKDNKAPVKSNPPTVVTPPYQPCTPWAGNWIQYAGDSTITGTLVIQLDTYVEHCTLLSIPLGPQGQESITYYKSNMPMFNGLLGHYCPMQLSLDNDTIHLLKNSKNYHFKKI